MKTKRFIHINIQHLTPEAREAIEGGLRDLFPIAFQVDGECLFIHADEYELLGVPGGYASMLDVLDLAEDVNADLVMLSRSGEVVPDLTIYKV